MHSRCCPTPRFCAAGETLPPCQIISLGTVVTSARGMRMSMPCWHISSCTGRPLSRIEQRLITSGCYESTIREQAASAPTIPMGQRRLFSSRAAQVTSTGNRDGKSIWGISLDEPSVSRVRLSEIEGKTPNNEWRRFIRDLPELRIPIRRHRRWRRLQLRAVAPPVESERHAVVERGHGTSRLESSRSASGTKEAVIALPRSTSKRFG